VTNDRPYDLVSLGEPLLRLSPPRFDTLEAARSFDVMPCGAPMNLAADLALLGWRTALLTRLPDGPLGRRILEACRGYGIDMAHVKTVPGARLGLTFVEFSAAPRTPLALYDRADSAASAMTAADFDWPAILSRTRLAHADGILPSLGVGCRDATTAYLRAAREAGCAIVFDVNYRSRLASPQEARAILDPLIAGAEVLVTHRRASEAIFGFSGSDEQLLRTYADRFGCRTVCLTSRATLPDGRGRWESRALDASQLYAGRPQEFQIVDRNGTGHAWLAAFLYARRLDRGTAYALDFANAALALAHTTFGDVVRLAPAEIEAVLDGRAGPEPQR